MKKEISVLYFGIVGSILLTGGTIADAITAGPTSYYPLLMVFGVLFLLVSLFLYFQSVTKEEVKK